MTHDTITTEVTFADLRAQYDDELEDLREAHAETVALAREQFGEDAMDTAPASVEDGDTLRRLQQTAEAYNEAGKSIQQRQHALERLADQYGPDDGGAPDPFALTMLSGQQLMDIETELRMAAQRKDTDLQIMQVKRKGKVVDAACVDAPAGIPTDGDGSPVPSECENPLTLALYDVAERLNQGGAADFRAPGFGDGDASGPPATSASPTDSAALSSSSASTDASTPPSGDS